MFHLGFRGWWFKNAGAHLISWRSQTKAPSFSEKEPKWRCEIKTFTIYTHMTPEQFHSNSFLPFLSITIRNWQEGGHCRKRIIHLKQTKSLPPLCCATDFVYIYRPIYPFDSGLERPTKTNVVCWEENFEGLWREERFVMEWAGKDCDFSIESRGARWISLICLWMGSFHYSC